MLDVIDRTGPLARALNVGFAIGVCLLINAFVFGTGFNVGYQGPVNELWYAPAGYVVGIVWIFLYSGMGLARHLLVEAGEQARNTRRLIVGLLLFCAIYPFYTSGFSDITACFWGNLATISLAVFTITRVARFSLKAALLLVPTIVWVTFATFVIARQQNWI